MCGIVGYIGKQKATPILLAGLTKLEYRGYDSAGIAIMENGKIQVIKDKGRVENLYKIKEIEDLKGTVGIAHTRWATHGVPSKENSHPHTDQTGDFAVVHNGIIENYNSLKSYLEANDYHFISQTDTEVIPNLIHYFYMQNKDFLKSVSLACNKLEGSYAISIICKYEPSKIVVAKKDSPLVIGKGQNENYISSDIPAILSFTKDFYLLDDYEFAVLSDSHIEFYNLDLEKISKQAKNITWDMSAAEKGDYADFMLKEIYEQPTAIRKTLENIEFDYNIIKNFNKIYIVACGTAMHAGLVRKTFNRKTLSCIRSS